MLSAEGTGMLAPEANISFTPRNTEQAYLTLRLAQVYVRDEDLEAKTLRLVANARENGVTDTDWSEFTPDDTRLLLLALSAIVRYRTEPEVASAAAAMLEEQLHPEMVAVHDTVQCLAVQQVMREQEEHPETVPLSVKVLFLGIGVLVDASPVHTEAGLHLAPHAA